MIPPLECAAVQELAPDLALGDVAGPARAAAVAHVAECPACRALVEELLDLADRLLLVAPEDEPPPGFESRVLSRLSETRPLARRRRRPLLVGLAAAAAAAVAVAAVGGGVLLAERSDRGTLGLNREYVAALTRVGGRSLRAAPLMNGGGTRVGQAFIYSGSPSWIFVSVDRTGQDGTYMVLCTGKTAGPIAWPGLRVVDGHGALGWTAQGDVRGLDHVQVLDPTGHVLYSAQLETSPT